MLTATILLLVVVFTTNAASNSNTTAPTSLFHETLARELLQAFGSIILNRNKATHTYAEYEHNICLWSTVRCVSDQNGKLLVRGITLSKFNIESSIPNIFLKITSLQSLDLSSNSFFGTFNPEKFPSSLEYLHIGDNKLTGHFPANIKEFLPNLKKLYINMNRLTGPVPSTWNFLKDSCFAGNYINDHIRYPPRNVYLRAFRHGLNGIHNARYAPDRKEKASTEYFILSNPISMSSLYNWADKIWTNFHANQTSVTLVSKKLKLMKRELQAGTNPDGQNSRFKLAYAFVLRNERSFGMSPLPLYLLPQYTANACSGIFLSFLGAPILDIELVKYDRRIQTEDVINPVRNTLPNNDQTTNPVQVFADHKAERTYRHDRLLSSPVEFSCLVLGQNCSWAENREDAARIIVDNLQDIGFASVLVDDAAVRIIDKGYAALRGIMSNASENKVHRYFDGGRLVGFKRESTRIFLELRQGCRDRNRFPWTNFGLKFADDLMNANDILDLYSRLIWKNIASLVSSVDPLANDSYPELNPGVMFAAPTIRMFSYDDRNDIRSNSKTDVNPSMDNQSRRRSHPMSDFASNTHVDKGLFTLAPPSTRPAIQMFHPRTGQIIEPEKYVYKHEWLIFAGEALAYISNQKIPGNIHRVAWTSSSDDDPGSRLSMPFFLRADPHANLHQFETSNWMTNRELMERHCVGKRPYVINNDW